MEHETLEAKLRNQLSPIYGLADMILLLDEKPEIKELLIKQAKQVKINKPIIDLLLKGIEAKTEDKPDVLREAFEAGRNFQFGEHKSWETYNPFTGNKQPNKELDFDDWIKKAKE